MRAREGDEDPLSTRWQPAPQKMVPFTTEAGFMFYVGFELDIITGLRFRLALARCGGHRE
jgi:hypothetical protein